jgi:hypothetical protein
VDETEKQPAAEDSPKDVVVATYGVTITARAKVTDVATMTAVPLNDEMVGEVEKVLSETWPHLTFKARSERTDR